jgi:transcription initiation factor TFIIH subunit 3
VYLKVDQLAGLLQYLIWVFLPAPPLRKMLGAPPPVK